MRSRGEDDHKVVDQLLMNILLQKEDAIANFVDVLVSQPKILNRRMSFQKTGYCICHRIFFKFMMSSNAYSSLSSNFTKGGCVGHHELSMCGKVSEESHGTCHEFGSV